MQFFCRGQTTAFCPTSLTHSSTMRSQESWAGREGKRGGDEGSGRKPHRPSGQYLKAASCCLFSFHFLYGYLLLLHLVFALRLFSISRLFFFLFFFDVTLGITEVIVALATPCGRPGTAHIKVTPGQSVPFPVTVPVPVTVSVPMPIAIPAPWLVPICTLLPPSCNSPCGT